MDAPRNKGARDARPAKAGARPVPGQQGQLVAKAARRKESPDVYPNKRFSVGYGAETFYTEKPFKHCRGSAV